MLFKKKKLCETLFAQRPCRRGLEYVVSPACLGSTEGKCVVKSEARGPCHFTLAGRSSRLICSNVFIKCYIVLSPSELAGCDVSLPWARVKRTSL